MLNGGVFRAARIAGRVVEALSAWRGGEAVVRLPDADPDLAVARGAVAYALARRGRGVRIGGGAARGYYVSIAPEDGRPRAVCVVPRGAEEGVPHVARGRTFALAVGRPVRFEALASDEGDASPGDVVDVDDERYVRLPPLVAVLDGAPGAEVRVALEGELTPVGTLDLACVETEPGDAGPRRHRLAFQLRADPTPPVVPSRAPSPSQAPSRRLEGARELLDRAFGKPRADAGGREAKDLLRELERLLGERAQWTTETNRALYDALLPDARARRRSPEHERVFWLLAGWCIRPGFGDPLDPGRVALLPPLFDERLAFPAEARGWQQFWIAWRRAAGGLDEVTQTRLRDFTDPWLATAEAGLKKPKKPALALDDALDMASSLERVAPPRRSQLGGWVLERTWTEREPRLWQAIGRLGARVPAYASVHHVVSPHVVERWLDHVLREKWDAVPAAAQAAVQLARRTGDRARDVNERVRREVEQRLVAAGAQESWVRAVREVVAVEESSARPSSATRSLRGCAWSSDRGTSSNGARAVGRVFSSDARARSSAVARPGARGTASGRPKQVHDLGHHEGIVQEADDRDDVGDDVDGHQEVTQAEHDGGRRAPRHGELAVRQHLEEGLDVAHQAPDGAEPAAPDQRPQRRQLRRQVRLDGLDVLDAHGGDSCLEIGELDQRHGSPRALRISGA